MSAHRVGHGLVAVFVAGLWACTAGCGSSSNTTGTPDGSTSSHSGSSGSFAGSGASGASGSAGSSAGSSARSGAASGAASGTTSGGSGAASGATSGSGAATGSSSGTGGTGASVVQFHKNASRDGVYVDPTFAPGGSALMTLHLDTAFMATVTGNVYAQPLYLASGPNGGEMIIVATENNHLAAFDGTGKQLWDNAFGSPESTGMPCGNINPLGITGTPVIDTSASPPTIYFDAMTAGPKHILHGVSLADGKTERTGFPIDLSTAVTGFDQAHQNQRGALLILGGVLYVPYGGHYGDCDPYYGYVVRVPLSDPAGIQAWHTKASRGGIWAVGGVASDGTSIFVSTGNTAGAGSTWGDGEGILRLSPTVTFSSAATDYFAPSAWSGDDIGDVDLGGTGPVLFDMGGAHYVLAMGKDASLYLLNRDNLGGIGGALSSTPVAGAQIIGAGAVYTTSQATYVAFRVNGGAPTGCPATGPTGGNLGVAKVTPGTPPSAKVAWCVAERGLGSPIVTSTNGTSNFIVWDASNRLYGYDGDTGTKVYAGGGASDAMASSMHYFSSPIVANGRILVATWNGRTSNPTPPTEHLYSFKP